MNTEDSIKFIRKHMHLAGFGNWDLVVDTRYKEIDSIAEVSLNMYLKKFNLKLSKDYAKMSDEEQKDTLIHELIHGRLLLSTMRTEKLVDQEEELFVNDITTLSLNISDLGKEG